MWKRKIFLDYFLISLTYVVSYILVFIKFLQHDLKINQEFDSFFFNSDAVFFNNVAKNIILENGSLRDWLFAGAPEIFPTVLFSIRPGTIYE